MPSFEAHERSDCDDGFAEALTALTAFAAEQGCNSILLRTALTP